MIVDYEEDLINHLKGLKSHQSSEAPISPPLTKEDITRFLHYLRGYQDGLGAIAAMLEIEFNA